MPVGTGYRIYVYYRAGTSGPWSDIFDDAAGRVDVTPVFNAIDVTAPATDVQKDQGSSLDVSWTTNAAVSSGQFSIWVVSADVRSWYGGTIVAADNGTPDSYPNDTIDLNVPRRHRLPHLRLLAGHRGQRPLERHLRRRGGDGRRGRPVRPDRREDATA